MKTIIIFLSCGLVLALTAFFLTADKTVDNKNGPGRQVALTVEEVAVLEKEWLGSVTASGPVFAWQEAVIGPEVFGHRLIEILVDVGDSVEKGQVLARYDSETLAAEYAELEANWIHAESNRKRAFSLRGTGAISDQAIEDYVNREAVAKAQLETKALQLQRVNVIAPDEGVICSRTAMLGSVGSPGDELFRIIRQNRLEWRGDLTSEQTGQIETGQTVLLNLQGGNTARGTVRQLSPVFEASTRMATVFVDLEPGEKARAGMYAEGQISLGRQVFLVAPSKSIVIRDGRTHVFKIENQGSRSTVRQVEVEIGQIKGDQTQLLSGLKLGDRIVLQGAGFLNDGDEVIVFPGGGV